MRHYFIRNQPHCVYEDVDELPGDIKPVADWRNADEGDWVKADDDCYVQILRKGSLSKSKGRERTIHYYRTCTGTYPVNKKMDTSRRENIYTISGLNSKTATREHLNKHEILEI